jgi:Short C-terminal domain
VGPLLRPRRRLLSLAAGAAATDHCQSHPWPGTPPAEWGADVQQVVAAEARAPLPPRTDTIAELERLARLHESGALSDEEFTAAKARVLGVQR